MNTTDILLVEDDPDLSRLLSDFLRDAGFRVVPVYSGEDGLIYLERGCARLMLLDLMLPGLDGNAVCRRVRRTSGMPILVISALQGEEAQIQSLDLGADDYLEKPFSVALLLAKVRSSLRRAEELRTESARLSAGPVALDKAARSAAIYGAPLTLSAKEFDLLCLLVENKGRTLRKEFIFNQVWGMDSFSEPSTLTVHINKLRDKIERDPKKPCLIVTVWGVGYRCEGD